MQVTRRLGTTELGYAKRTTSDTTTNTDYASAISNKITDLSVTVVGEGLPARIEFFCPGVYHSSVGIGVAAALVINGALTNGQFGTGESPSASSGRGNLYFCHRMILTAGVSYTFEIGKWVSSAGTGNYTALADAPMHLAVHR